MQGISGINFEFYRLNHQFPDNFKFYDLRSLPDARRRMRSGKRTPDGDKDAI